MDDSNSYDQAKGGNRYAARVHGGGVEILMNDVPIVGLVDDAGADADDPTLVIWYEAPYGEDNHAFHLPEWFDDHDARLPVPTDALSRLNHGDGEELDRRAAEMPPVVEQDLHDNMTEAWVGDEDWYYAVECEIRMPGNILNAGPEKGPDLARAWLAEALGSIRRGQVGEEPQVTFRFAVGRSEFFEPGGVEAQEIEARDAGELGPSDGD
jgi:hypothetical protein